MKVFYKVTISILILILILPTANQAFASQPSVARQWNDALLYSIRRDFARPTIHARNLFHVTMAMYDSYAVYDTTASTYLLGKTVGDFECPFDGFVLPDNPQAIEDARHETISYACYRLLKQRFQFSPGALESLPYYDSLMTMFEYPTSFFSQDYSTGSPAALGNYIAGRIMEFGFQDGSNQQGNYSNLFYETANPQIIVNEPGNPTMVNPNRWQEIFLDGFIDQSGNLISISPPHLSPEWGELVPFSMDDTHKTVYERDDQEYQVYLDPGAPPYIDTTQFTVIEDPYKWGFLLVSLWQGHLDPTDGVMWDISPASIGNIDVSLFPESFEDYPDFYNTFDGGDPSLGWDLNPKTGLPYEPQMVPRGDYGRILAEFWADGPDSETPPGHWFTILNYVTDHPDLVKRWKGEGPVLSDLEWDIRTYFTLGGAMYDASIAAWSAKGYYDYPRPVSIIRWMADKGQSSDPDAPNYHPAGVPLIPNHIEQVLPGDALAGENDENLYKIKLNTWKGHFYIDDPEVDEAGVGWILAEEWWPYQRPTFVTPPFAGYVSGHSTFSRTAAEVMTLMTGDRFFPGGMGEFPCPQNEFLVFEQGPSMNVTLQWATYQDASDQCSLSRIWGGIHPPQDDIPGRKIGIELGPLAFNNADSILTAGEPFITDVAINNDVVTDENILSTVLTLVYNEDMNTSFSPLVEFIQGTPLDYIEIGGFNWTDSRTCVLTLSVIESEIELDDLSIRVQGARDLSNKSQRIYLSPALFNLDTRNPLVLSSEINLTTVNISNIGEGTLSLEINYDQGMNTNEMPIIEYPNGETVLALSQNMTESSWVNDSLFNLVFDVNDIEEEIADLQLQISSGKDINGNNQVPYNQPELIRIDTKRPLLNVVSANTYLITQEMVANQESFDIVILFSEEMNTNQEPLITLIGGAGINSILLESSSESGWLNPYTYQKAYDINPIPINMYSIDVSINEAFDIAGNSLDEAIISNFLDVELDPTSVSEFNKSNVSVYPNPVKVGSPLIVKGVSLNKNFRADILNLSGQVVFSKSFNSSSIKNGNIIIQTSELTAGSYTVRFVSDERAEVVRLVVVQ